MLRVLWGTLSVVVCYAMCMSSQLKYAIRRPYGVVGVFFDGSDESLRALSELYLLDDAVCAVIEDFGDSDDSVVQLLVFDKQLGVVSFGLTELDVFVGFWLVLDSGGLSVWSDADWRLRCRGPILSWFLRSFGVR